LAGEKVLERVGSDKARYLNMDKRKQKPKKKHLKKHPERGKPLKGKGGTR